MKSISLSQVYLCLFYSNLHIRLSTFIRQSMRTVRFGVVGGAIAEEQKGGAVTPGIVTFLFAPQKP